MQQPATTNLPNCDTVYTAEIYKHFRGKN
jgi:hypothetical protein